MGASASVPNVSADTRKALESLPESAQKEINALASEPSSKVELTESTENALKVLPAEAQTEMKEAMAKATESLRESRAKAYYMALVAEECEQFDHMLKYVESFVQASERICVEVSAEERKPVAIAGKNVVGALRAAWRVSMTKKTETSSELEYLKEHRETITGELTSTCDRMLTMVSSMLPNASGPEAQVFFLKMKADYMRWKSEVLNGEEKEKIVKAATEAYDEARTVAEKELPVWNPVRLGQALNHSVHMYEIVENKDKACEMAKIAFEAALEKLEDIPEAEYKDATMIMQLLRDNLQMWSKQMQADPETPR